LRLGLQPRRGFRLHSSIASDLFGDQWFSLRYNHPMSPELSNRTVRASPELQDLSYRPNRLVAYESVSGYPPAIALAVLARFAPARFELNSKIKSVSVGLETDSSNAPRRLAETGESQPRVSFHAARRFIIKSDR